MTSALSSQALAPLADEPGQTAVLLDIDGTLAPIVEHADDATVPESTRQLLIKLARKYAVVACVSGRRATQARAMVSIGTITYLGSHGTELLRAGWTEPKIDPALEPWTEKIAAFAREVDSSELRLQRIRIEDKGPIVAFHWRASADEAAARARVERIAEQAGAQGLSTHWGRKVLEVRAPVEFDKGIGITNLLREQKVENAVFAGDDVTDLDAFRALREMRDGGELRQAVLVGVSAEDGPPEITEQADIVVDGTEGVRELLSALL